MPNTGVTYAAGLEDMHNLWNRLMHDTGAIAGDAAWVREMTEQGNEFPTELFGAFIGQKATIKSA